MATSKRFGTTTSPRSGVRNWACAKNSVRGRTAAGRPSVCRDWRRTGLNLKQPAMSAHQAVRLRACGRSEEHTSELQSLMSSSYAVFSLNKQHNPTKKCTTQSQQPYIRSISYYNSYKYTH